MTKQEWINKIQESEAFAEHVYDAIVDASVAEDEEERADALASAVQTYNYVGR